MGQTGPHSSTPEKPKLELRIDEAPQLVIEYLRLARILEQEGDMRGAAATFQKAYFFLPNGPAILEGMARLSSWVDMTRSPIALERPTVRKSEAEAETEQEDDFSEDRPPRGDYDAELDQLIAGLGKGHLRRDEDAPPASDVDLADDEGVVATETLARIFVSQNQFEEAIRVYDRLAERETDPAKAASLREKAADLRKRLG